MGDEKLLIVGLTRIVTSREVQNLHKSLRTICFDVIVSHQRVLKDIDFRPIILQDIYRLTNR